MIAMKIMIIMRKIGSIMFGEPVPSMIGGKGKIQMKPPALPVEVPLGNAGSEIRTNPTKVNVIPKKRSKGNSSLKV